MAYTFGGVVGSRCAFTANLSFCAGTSWVVSTGWYLPTTLTATRRYWGSGAVNGARIAGTTSEIELLTDGATTDGVWSTTGAGITTNKWWFIATAGTFTNTGPAAAWRVWIGDVDQRPVEVTVTQNTGPAGNFTGNTTITFGNTTGNSTAFQGDIADCSIIGGSTFGAGSAMNIAAAGTITQDEADHIMRSYLMPMWLGQPAEAIRDRRIGSWDYNYWSGNLLALVYRAVNANAVPFLAPTLTSSTFSANGNPRPSLAHPVFGARVNMR